MPSNTTSSTNHHHHHRQPIMKEGRDALRDHLHRSDALHHYLHGQGRRAPYGHHTPKPAPVARDPDTLNYTNYEAQKRLHEQRRLPVQQDIDYEDESEGFEELPPEVAQAWVRNHGQMPTAGTMTGWVRDSGHQLENGEFWGCCICAGNHINFQDKEGKFIKVACENCKHYLCDQCAWEDPYN